MSLQWTGCKKFQNKKIVGVQSNHDFEYFGVSAEPTFTMVPSIFWEQFVLYDEHLNLHNVTLFGIVITKKGRPQKV